MRTSATGKGCERGFTIVELMIVVTIIGLASAAVLFVIPDPRGRLIDDAERFAARTHAARDFAIVGARDVAVRVTAAGYAFDLRQDGAWVPIDTKPLQSATWSDGAAALVGESGQARIAFDPTGLASAPATVTLVRGGERVDVTIAIDGGVRVGG